MEVVQQSAQHYPRLVTDCKSSQSRLSCNPAINRTEDLQTPLAEHDVSQCLSWNLQQDLNLPSLGIVLTSADLSQQGLKLPQVTQVQVRFRSGGESIRVSKRACSKDLKGVFQEFGLPPWLRDRIPLIFYQDELICVWNIAISDGY